MTIKCFLPCRKGSERVPKKNIKPFAVYSHGLIEIKLKQLLAVDLLDEIILSTNDEEIIEYATDLKHKKLRVHRRVDSLSSSSTSTDELVAHALDLIPNAHILWTHVTSPFVTSKDYEEIIRRYLLALEEGYDSLMTTNRIHGFLWNDYQPINYDRKIERWPRTQTIEAIHEINSAVFLSHSSNYTEFNDRIGNKPLLYSIDKVKSFDIDWKDDFAVAECMIRAGVVQL